MVLAWDGEPVRQRAENPGYKADRTRTAKERPADWHADIPTYGQVIYRELWAGVDLKLREKDRTLKYEFHVLRRNAKTPNTTPTEIPTNEAYASPRVTQPNLNVLDTTIECTVHTKFGPKCSEPSLHLEPGLVRVRSDEGEEWRTVYPTGL